MAHNNPATAAPSESTALNSLLGGKSTVPVAGVRAGQDIEARRERVCIDVLNTGAHAVRVRTHAHFFDVDRALKFDRAIAYGMRLDVSSGGSRFEPGEIVRVQLVRIAGPVAAYGSNWRAVGAYRPGEVRQRGLKS
ncbi:MAG: urease subunit beta [Betaproteobacteria bacterium]